MKQYGLVVALTKDGPVACRTFLEASDTTHLGTVQTDFNNRRDKKLSGNHRRVIGHLRRARTACCPVEQLDRVNDRCLDSGPDLQHATDVAGGNDIGGGFRHCTRLESLEFLSDFALQEVVRARRAAAHVRISRFADFETHGAKQRLRYVPDPLSVL